MRRSINFFNSSNREELSTAIARFERNLGLVTRGSGVIPPQPSTYDKRKDISEIILQDSGSGIVSNGIAEIQNLSLQASGVSSQSLQKVRNLPISANYRIFSNLKNIDERFQYVLRLLGMTNVYDLANEANRLNARLYRGIIISFFSTIDRGEQLSASNENRILQESKNLARTISNYKRQSIWRP